MNEGICIESRGCTYCTGDNFVGRPVVLGTLLTSEPMGKVDGRFTDDHPVFNIEYNISPGVG